MPDTPSGVHRRRVHEAVEEFIRLHEAGRAPDPEAWARDLDEVLRPEVLEQCRIYLEMLPALKPPAAGAGAPPGARLGRWRLREELGRGGMAVVYRAVEESGRRTVALKVLHPALAASVVSEKRFQREAEAAARLEHPHIVRIHEAGSVDGWLYTAMDLVEGESLDRRLDALRLRTPRPGQEELQDLALRVGRQIGAALEHAHSRGVIHRDLKPQNILLDPNGDASLTDFGIAMVRDSRDLTLTGQLLGTPYYMSPEQALARRVRQDHRTDLFSLGVVLYEILSLERPFDGPTSDQVLYAISFEQPASLRGRVPDLPRDLETVVLKCLEKRPEDRYRTAGELVADLCRIARQQRIRGRRPGAAARLGRRVRAHPWSSAALLVGAVGLLVLGRSFFSPPVDAASLGPVAPVREVVWVDFDLGVPEEGRWKDLRITAFPFDPFTERRRPGFLLGHGEVHDVALPPGDYWIRYDLPGQQVRTDLRILPEAGTRETLRLYLDRPPLDPASEGMVWIPAGSVSFTHRFVAEAASPADHPREVRTRVEAFWIDRSEVSNGEYLEYVEATGAPLPRGWPRPGSEAWKRLPEDFLRLPVTGVAWREAADFAAWKGKRLPTLAEWLRAAQGPRGWSWPWGPRWEPPDGGDPWQRVNIVRERPAEGLDPWSAYLRHARPVDQPMEGMAGPASAGAGGSFGLLHVLGNVWEFTASRALALEQGEPVPFGEQVIIAGYSWRSWLEMSEPQLEGLNAYGDLGMHDRDWSVGFRCVADGRPPRR